MQEGLERAVAALRVDEAAAARRRGRMHREAEFESATLFGLMCAAAEQQATVAVEVTAGRRYNGVVTAVLEDGIIVAGANVTTMIRFEALGTVRSGQELRSHDPLGSAALPTLVEMLAEWATDRPLVTIWTGATSVVGELASVGTTVATLLAESGPGRIYLSLNSVTEASVSDATAPSDSP